MRSKQDSGEAMAAAQLRGSCGQGWGSFLKEFGGVGRLQLVAEVDCLTNCLIFPTIPTLAPKCLTR